MGIDVVVEKRMRGEKVKETADRLNRQENRVTGGSSKKTWQYVENLNR